MSKFFFYFIALGFIELAVIIKVGSLIGVFPTLFLLILSSFIGIFLLKKQGLKIIKELNQWPPHQILKNSSMPLENIIILISGYLLIVPGFLTDFIGLCGFISPVRRWAMQKIKHTIADRFSYTAHHTVFQNDSEENIIEGEIEKTDSFLKKK